MVGIGPLLAAQILGEVGHVHRFPTRDHFASANGTAPIPVALLH
jgi:transposase